MSIQAAAASPASRSSLYSCRRPGRGFCGVPDDTPGRPFLSARIDDCRRARVCLLVRFALEGHSTPTAVQALPPVRLLARLRRIPRPVQRCDAASEEPWTLCERLGTSRGSVAGAAGRAWATRQVVGRGGSLPWLCASRSWPAPPAAPPPAVWVPHEDHVRVVTRAGSLRRRFSWIRPAGAMPRRSG